MRLTVIGNPVNRRVGLFRAAVCAAGLTPPTVVDWRDVAQGRPVSVAPGSFVRIDSPGEDAEVDRLFRQATTAAEPGQIVGTAAWYGGFADALARVAALPAVQLLNDPAEILTMFDKRACHAHLRARGVPVPAALPTPGSYQELRAAMAAASWSRVFVKPMHGSSASGVLALRTAGDRVRVTTSVELDRVTGQLFNSLRVRDYHDERDIAAIVDILARDGVQVERWFPKAGLAGRVVDLRIVVIAGRPTHAVVRSSHAPMTNLHLGGHRGDLDELRRVVGESAYAAALRTCVRVAECFPNSLHIGVDLMFSPDWRRHVVAEANAFGDLLPGLLVDGRDTYAEQIAALLSGRFGGFRPNSPVHRRLPEPRRWLDRSSSPSDLPALTA